MECYCFIFIFVTVYADLTDGGKYTSSGNNCTITSTKLSTEVNWTFSCERNQTHIDFSDRGLKFYMCLFDYNCSFNHIRTIDLSRNDISNISATICDAVPNVQNIDFSHNVIRTLEDNLLRSCTSIKRLSLRDNVIRLIHRDAFLRVETLEDLDISNNKLSGIASGLFDSFMNLKYLNLSRNDIYYITNSVFLQTRSLESLDLSYNKLHSLREATLFGAINLKILDLKANIIDSNDFSFLENLSKLTWLDISSNKLQVISQRDFSNYNISRISLSNMSSLNWISSDAFLNCLYLTHVYLQNNKNVILHENAFNGLDQLQIVDLSHSQVLVLPNVSDNTTLYLSNSSVYCQCYDVKNSSASSHGIDNKTCRYPPGSVVTGQEVYEQNATCGPYMMTELREIYYLRISDNCVINCRAIGKPRPSIRLEHCPELSNGTYTSCYTVLENISVYELKINSLNQEGGYRCTANSNNKTVHSYFKVIVNRTNVKLRVLTRGENWLIVTWGQSKCPKHPVILNRPFELTSKYNVQNIHAHWKLYQINDLTPSTGYEICMASGSDIMDKACIRAWTKRKENTIPGVHTDSVVISVLIVSAIVFGTCVVSTCIRCASKIRNISKRYVYIVNSESRDSFRDFTVGDQQIFTNPCADFVVESSIDS